MTLPGIVRNGVVVLEGESTLPEGTPVSVISRASPAIHVAKHQKRVEFPIVRSSKPGSVNLTGEMIAEILDDEDMAS
jgi:hypothetical protein